MGTTSGTVTVKDSKAYQLLLLLTSMLIGITRFKLARLVLNLWAEGTQTYVLIVSLSVGVTGCSKKIAPAISGLSL